MELWPRGPAISAYRGGVWQEAIRHFTGAAEKRKNERAYDWLHVAMAHHHLGNIDAASQWYDRAVAWIEEQQPKPTHFDDLRARAAELLERK
jgi:hypothetical protein